MAYHHRHRLLHGQGTYRYPNDVHRCFPQDDQNKVRTSSHQLGSAVSQVSRRFGETLPVVDNILRVSPFEVSQRHLRTISDYALYKKLHSTLPAAVLASQRQRVRDGEQKAIRDLWQSKDKTFLALDFEWSERNTATCLEWGYAAVRCSHLEAYVFLSADKSSLSLTVVASRVGVWPPDPDTNYRLVFCDPARLGHAITFSIPSTEGVTTS